MWRPDWLHRIHLGVFVVGHLAHTPLQAQMAAVLAAGDGAAVSHESAAHLWGLAPEPRGLVEIISTRECRKPGLRAHRTRHLPGGDVTLKLGIPVTTPARTLLDLAARANLGELERLVAQALATGLVRERQLRAAADRAHAAGATRMRATLVREDGPQFTRSEAEARFLALVRSARLPKPEVNARIHGREVDFLWRAAGLIVEIDGFAFHSDRASFERDRLRDASSPPGACGSCA